MEKKFPTHIVAVDGIVENEKNQILLVKNSYKCIYTIPGGQVEIGENLNDALIREIKEETGIDISVEKLICVSSNKGTHAGYNGYTIVPTKVMFGFTCKYVDGELCTSDETSESLWIDKNAVLNYITEPNLIERFKAYLNYEGSVQYLEYITKPEYNLKLKRLI
ncbi:NUDIX hydrolase [Sedimentibacter sp. zth1]|uniref:NUDIX hydrolase n=1 Tax=Sedimentibacter sp. zth1 TaxID=2816908 RepID=UPI001A92EB30|nr:NUDIX hydrolase [Sedimentibacter sp. zth1]QSX05921.1 NUDIX hydrolase [Sedimentibacter sp. zth1]